MAKTVRLIPNCTANARTVLANGKTTTRRLSMAKPLPDTLASKLCIESDCNKYYTAVLLLINMIY